MEKFLNKCFQFYDNTGKYVLTFVKKSETNVYITVLHTKKRDYRMIFVKEYYLTPNPTFDVVYHDMVEQGINPIVVEALLVQLQDKEKQEEKKEEVFVYLNSEWELYASDNRMYFKAVNKEHDSIKVIFSIASLLDVILPYDVKKEALKHYMKGRELK